MRTLIPAILLVLSFLTASAQAVTEQERVIVKFIDDALPAAKSLLREVVDINSGTMNFTGVRTVGQVFEREFSALGFNTQWVDGAGFDRAGHFVASYGQQGPRFLLIGHLDTVFASDSPFQSMMAVDEYHVAGPGITDMKGGDIIILEALRSLKSAGLLDNMQVRVVMTGDEESRGTPHSLANKALLDAGRWADYALGFEDGDGDPATAVIARRSAGRWRLDVTGRPAHSSQIFRADIGYGAAFEIARVLDQWRQALASEPNLTFNAGLLIAGTDVELDDSESRGNGFGKGNVIPQTATATGGIRALSHEQLDKAVETMQRIAADHLPHTQTRFAFLPSYPPMAPRQSNRALLAVYSQISEELGFGPVRAVDPRRAGAADISFVADYVKAAIDGLGLMGDGGHTVDEVADIRTLRSQTQRAALLLHRLAIAEGVGTP